MEEATTTDSIMAVDLQRRLELKEFYIERGEKVSANLVDEMFRISNFSEIKVQVQESFGTLPKNWKENNRYDKYKKMLKLGVRPEKVREQMEEDGLDPDEFDVQGGVPKNTRLVSKATRGASNLFRKKSRVYISGALRRTRSKIVSSGKPEIKSFRDNSTNEISRLPFIKKKKTNRKPGASSNLENTIRSDVSDSESKASSASRASLYDQHDEDFAYSKEDIKLSRKNRGKKVFGKLTEKNKIGEIHDAQHYFKKAPAKVLRKTAVSNIKRNAVVKHSMFEDKHLTLTRDEMQSRNRDLPPPPPVAPKSMIRRALPTIPKRSIHPLNNSVEETQNENDEEKIDSLRLPPPLPPIEDDPRPESFFLPPPPPPPSPNLEDEPDSGSVTFSPPAPSISFADELPPPLPPDEEDMKIENSKNNFDFDVAESYISFKGLQTPSQTHVEPRFQILTQEKIPRDHSRRKSGSRPTQE